MPCDSKGVPIRIDAGWHCAPGVVSLCRSETICMEQGFIPSQVGRSISDKPFEVNGEVRPSAAGTHRNGRLAVIVGIPFPQGAGGCQKNGRKRMNENRRQILE